MPSSIRPPTEPTAAASAVERRPPIETTVITCALHTVEQSGGVHERPVALLSLVSTNVTKGWLQVEADPMTMPMERMRAIRFGFEMLDEAVHDNELPSEIRQRAELVLQHYPRTAELEELLTSDGVTLPQTWASALIEARSLLVDLRRLSGSTAMTRWSVTVTLRHFPDECDLWYFSRAGDLGEWFAPEARRDV